MTPTEAKLKIIEIIQDIHPTVSANDAKLMADQIIKKIGFEKMYNDNINMGWELNPDRMGQ